MAALVLSGLLAARAASAAPGRSPQDDAEASPFTDNPFESGDFEEPRRSLLPRAEFLEKSYIFYDVPNVGPEDNKPLMFEAQVAPHLFLLNDWHKVERQGDTSRFLHALSFTFLLRLRMVGDDSTPVRPPSFMPRLDYQLFRVWRPDAPKQLSIAELRVSLGHHSNGQQYCPFDESRVSGDPEPCPPVDTRRPDLRPLNYRSGDFSTNYLILGAHYARLWLDADRFEEARVSFGVQGETNPTGFGPGGIDREQSELYGPHRLKLDFEASRYHPRPLGLPSALSGVSAVSGSVEFMMGAASGVASDREMVEVSHVFDRSGGLGLFARFVTGQDYLNILFAAPRISTLQVGLIWDLSPRLQYIFKPGGTSLDPPAPASP